MDSRDPLVINNLAWQLVTGPAGQRDPPRALKLIQEVVQRQPSNHAFLNTLGVAQYRNGLYEAAIATLEKSLALGKGQEDAFSLYVLAMCHAGLNQPMKAEDCFAQADRWATQNQERLSMRERDELQAFRAEAAEVLRK